LPEQHQCQQLTQHRKIIQQNHQDFLESNRCQNSKIQAL
jgi:hypothetical protein